MTATNTYNYDADCAKQDKTWTKIIQICIGLKMTIVAATAVFGMMNPPAECFGPAGCGIEPVQETTASPVTVLGDGGHIEYID